jgi:alpha-D-xyloside xylohydrolase
LYEDEDSNYNYEKGIFATIQINYNEKDRSLTINDRKGEFPGMLQKRIFNIIWITKSKAKSLDLAQQPDERVLYGGKKQVVHMVMDK